MIFRRQSSFRTSSESRWASSSDIWGFWGWLPSSSSFSAFDIPFSIFHSPFTQNRNQTFRFFCGWTGCFDIWVKLGAPDLGAPEHRLISRWKKILKFRTLSRIRSKVLWSKNYFTKKSLRIDAQRWTSLMSQKNLLTPTTLTNSHTLWKKPKRNEHILITNKQKRHNNDTNQFNVSTWVSSPNASLLQLRHPNSHSVSSPSLLKVANFAKKRFLSVGLVYSEKRMM